MRPAQGITRTEVLVVVFLCAAAAVALFYATDVMDVGATEPRCLTNLEALRTTMAAYAGERDGKYPFAADDPPTSTYTNQNDGLASFAREMGIPGKMFVCPATDDVPLSTRPDDAGASSDEYSYAYQAPFARAGVLGVGVNESTPNEVVFLGDKPPMKVASVDWGSWLSKGQMIDDLLEDDPNRLRLMAGMSSHHRDGVVMMVASKAWVFKAGRGDVGFEDDAVFMGGGPAKTGTPAKTITDRRDSLLLRPDGR